MPIYEYKCAACQEIHEVLQKMSDPPPETCPHCGGKELAKIMSQTSFVLKGSGWYVTDFRDNKKPAAKDSKTETSTASESKSDTTPATESAPADTKTSKSDTPT